MKQKILSVLLFSAMILSMAGCGGTQSTEPNENESETSQEDEVVTSTVSETTTAEQEQTESETTTTEPVEEEPPKEILKISDYESFENGTLLFKIKDTGYVYDVSENKMYDYDLNEFRNAYYACGKLLRYDNNGNTAFVNLETMETFDEDCTYYNGYVSEYNPMYTLEESFDGNVYSFGILDSNGKWVLPMSSEYAICDYLQSYRGGILTSSFVFLQTNSSSPDYLIYNYNTDEITEFKFRVNNVICTDKSLEHVIYYYNINSFSVYNTKTHETTNIEDEYDNYIILYNSIILEKSYTSFVLINKKGDILNYDLSAYSFDRYPYERILDATEDYIVFNATNTNGDEYTIILDKDGNRVIEPIKGYSDRYDMRIYGDYIVYTYPNKSFIVNCKTGEMKSGLNIEKFDIDSGKLLIESEGNYYLADVSDPDTLINPFEIAEMQ